MAEKMKSEGVCRSCNRTLSGARMQRHLRSCKEYQKSKGAKKVYLIKAEAWPFFVFFEVDKSLMLSDIDTFLRDLWCECCSHLSSFTIGGQTFFSYCWEDYDQDMSVKIKNALEPGMQFKYEYDFGSTTDLMLKCVLEKTGEKGINIVARNNPPEIKCDYCGELAEDICTECMWEEKGFLCKECKETHECEESLYLPVVNSPRTGMCGFTGEDCRLINK